MLNDPNAPFLALDSHYWLLVNGYIEVYNYTKKKNNEDFAINSFQDNETYKAPLTLT
jgi:hypothetical protein